MLVVSLSGSTIVAHGLCINIMQTTANVAIQANPGALDVIEQFQYGKSLVEWRRN